MRTCHFAAALALLGLAVPTPSAAWIAVRAPIYHPMAAVAVVAVATRPVYYAPPPTVVVTQPVYTTPAPQPASPPLTTTLPVNTTMWTLPSGCNKVSAGEQTFFVCGPNWLKAYPGANGSTYYGVVAPP
jgi:hypothetical protein